MGANLAGFGLAAGGAGLRAICGFGLAWGCAGRTVALAALASSWPSDVFTLSIPATRPAALAELGSRGAAGLIKCLTFAAAPLVPDTDELLGWYC